MEKILTTNGGALNASQETTLAIELFINENCRSQGEMRER